MTLKELIGAIVIEASRQGIDPLDLEIDMIDINLSSDINDVEVIVDEKFNRVLVV